MSNENESRSNITGIGQGFNARVLPSEPTPTTTPKAKPSEGTPQQPAAYQGHSKAYPESRRGDQLTPGFARFSESLAAEEAAEREIRQGRVREHFGVTDEERLRIHRDLLAEQVRAGEIDNDTANHLFENAHPGVDPATLRPRQS